MDSVLIQQFFTKIDIRPEQDGIDEDMSLLCIARAILDPSPTIASRAILAARTVIVGGGEATAKLFEAAEKLANIVTEPQSPNTLFNLLLARCEDERVNSRKAAISAAEALCAHLGDARLLNLCVEMLQTRCRDHSLTIRIQAAESLTRLLLRFAGGEGGDVESLEQVWLHSVMSLIVDREMNVQQYAAKLVAEVLITPLIHQHTEQSAWRLLSVVERGTELRRLLLRVLVFMHNEKLLTTQLVQVLLRNVEHEQFSRAAWMMLAEMSAFSQRFSVDPTSAVTHFCKMSGFNNGENRVVQYVAKVLANCADALNEEQRGKLQKAIKYLLTTFNLATTHIPTVCYSLSKTLTDAKASTDDASSFRQFNKLWFHTCVKGLDEIIYEAEDESPASQGTTSANIFAEKRSQFLKEHMCEKLERIVFSIGECLQYAPDLMDRNIFKLFKLLIASDTLQALAPIMQHVAESAGSTPRPDTPGDLFLDPGSQLANQNGITFNNIDPGRQSVVVLKVYGRQVRQELLTRRVRAQSVLTLGKLCLLDERLAKKCVPVFAKQLEVNPDHIVRNNIVVVVCDLCIRYTLLVDKYSAIMASCLNDTSVLVRQQTLMLLTNLIKEQFLKWEGAIIFRFMMALLDSHPLLRKYAEFCLSNILLPQFPMMFFNYFLECLFHFNQVKHQTWNVGNNEVVEIIQPSQETSQLTGADKHRERMVLYKFMMKTFSDDQKYKICERIACEVFASVRDPNAPDGGGGEGLRFGDPNVASLLDDAFRVMKSPDMKLSLQLGQRHVDDQADEDDPSDDHKKVAKKLIAKVFGDKIVGATVPHLLQLREFLIEKRSPLAADCFDVILELHKDHYQNFEEIFASDPMIKAEIDFHLKQQRRNNNNNPNNNVERSEAAAIMD